MAVSRSPKPFMGVRIPLPLLWFTDRCHMLTAVFFYVWKPLFYAGFTPFFVLPIIHIWLTYRVGKVGNKGNFLKKCSTLCNNWCKNRCRGIKWFKTIRRSIFLLDLGGRTFLPFLKRVLTGRDCRQLPRFRSASSLLCERDALLVTICYNRGWSFQA